MSDIEIEIDGQKLTAKPNQTVIQVADAAGIYIPRFCYHKNLSIPANCRMCLVEVEKSPKAVPACATPCMPGMKVFTQSEKTLAAQRAVMEFLLINHPLDCPICDQGGECELQDLSMGFGSSHSKYDECKRSVVDENLGPLIATEMTRCIQCTRCVRFGDEVAGLRELGLTFRGENEQISTYVEQAIKSEVSGNIIDICPVGALTSKPYRFTARAWELQQAPSIAPHDCLGSNLNVHTRYGKVMRVVARENLNINDVWISDRDRFSYVGLYHPDRLEEPMARIDGKWQAVDWKYAFELIASKLHEVINEFGADKVGALASPSSTLEEFYLLQKILRGVGSPHVDHRLREIDTNDQGAVTAFPGLGMQIANLNQSNAVLLIGSNIQKDQPIAGIKIRAASLKGAPILAINSVDYQFNFKLSAKKIVAPHRMVETLAALANELENPSDKSDSVLKTMAEHLRGKEKVCILLGSSALHDKHASAIRYYAQKIAQLVKGKWGLLTDGANSAGAYLAGAVPHHHAGCSALNHIGLNAYEMLHKPRKAYILLNVEPDLDCVNPSIATEALKQAKLIVALSLFRNKVLEEHANVILPMAAFTETSGTFVNTAGEWQSFTGVAEAFASSRPAWKILRVLGNFLHLDGFNYESSEEVKHEVWSVFEKLNVDQVPDLPTPAAQPENVTLSRIGEIPIYALDSLVRRSKPLQETQTIMEGNVACVRLHPDTASKLRVQDGDTVQVKQAHGVAQLPVQIDSRIALDAAWIPGGIPETSTLGDLFGEVEVTKA